MYAQLKDLIYKIHTTVHSVFFSQKIEQYLKLREAKPPIVNQQCLVYKFECNTGYVVSHGALKNTKALHQLASIFAAPKDVVKNFSVLMRCTNKFDGLVYDMSFYLKVKTYS